MRRLLKRNRGLITTRRYDCGSRTVSSFPHHLTPTPLNCNSAAPGSPTHKQSKLLMSALPQKEAVLLVSSCTGRSSPSYHWSHRSSSCLTSARIPTCRSIFKQNLCSQISGVSEAYPSPAVVKAPLRWAEPNPRPPAGFDQSEEPHRSPEHRKVPLKAGQVLWPCAHRGCCSVFRKRVALQMVSTAIILN